MANSLSAANHNNRMISLINPFTNQHHHQLDDVNLFTGNCGKCRSCFMNLPECQDQACVAIDSSHRQTFFTLAGVELSLTPKSVDFLCLNCANMMKVFSEMGKAAKMQSRYIEFMQNQIDIVKVEPAEVISLFEIKNNDVDDEIDQIYPYDGDANEMESPDHAADENMRDRSVQLTRLSSQTIELYSTDKTAQISNELKCSIDGCNKICKNKNSLYSHRYQFHKRDSNDKSTCLDSLDCGKVCKNKKTLRNHMRMHKKNFSCDICGKLIAEQKCLIDHMETYHTNNSKFNCTKCSKIFKSQRKLKDHQRNTHDAKKFKCDQCNAAFAIPCLLADHDKVKHEGKRFHCSYPGCSLKFTRKYAAAKHLRLVHKLKDDEYKKHCNQINFF